MVTVSLSDWQVGAIMIHRSSKYVWGSTLWRRQQLCTAHASDFQHYARPRRPLQLISSNRYSQNATPTLEEAAPLSSRQPHPRWPVRRLLYGVSFLLLGLTVGQFMRFVVVPPPLPAPGTPEDILFLQKIQKDADELEMVKELRDHSDEWEEHEAYAHLSHAARETNLTAGALAGSRGLGIQRVFWNEEEKRIIAVVFFGGALSGWPGVTHGGVIATILGECTQRIASQGSPAITSTS